MKKLLLFTALSGIFFISGASFAQETQEPAQPPAPPAAVASSSQVPANPPEDNIPPSPAEEKAYAAKLKVQKNAILQNEASDPNFPAMITEETQPDASYLPTSNEEKSIPKTIAPQKTPSSKLLAANNLPPAPPPKNTQKQEPSLENQRQREAPPSSQDMENLFFAGAKNPNLSTDEFIALNKINAWNSGTAVPPSLNKDGAIQFTFGTQTPHILCAVMQVCDLQLQAGEKISNISVGDSARWKLDPSVTGTGDNATEHLIIKPLEAGLQTSAVISTDPPYLSPAFTVLSQPIYALHYLLLP